MLKKPSNFNKQQKDKWLPLDLARITRIAKVSNHKVSKHSNHKIVTPKQMFQRLPIALAQVKSGNTSGNLLHEIRQIIYSLYQTKEVTKKYIII